MASRKPIEGAELEDVLKRGTPPPKYEAKEKQK